METKTLVGIGRHALGWVVTLFPVAAFVLAYVWLMTFSGEHSKVGNLALWVLMWCGAFFSFYFFMRISRMHELVSWSGVRVISRWTVITFIVIGVWHAVGGIFIPSAEAQHWFAYGPVVAFLSFIFLLFMKFFIEFPKSH